MYKTCMFCNHLDRAIEMCTQAYTVYETSDKEVFTAGTVRYAVNLLVKNKRLAKNRNYSVDTLLSLDKFKI